MLEVHPIHFRRRRATTIGFAEMASLNPTKGERS